MWYMTRIRFVIVNGPRKEKWKPEGQGEGGGMSFRHWDQLRMNHRLYCCPMLFSPIVDFLIQCGIFLEY